MARTIADAPVVGEPVGTPARPPVQPAYPKVFDSPPPDEGKPLTPEERKTMEDELKAARERTQKAGKDAEKQPTN